MGQVIIPKNQRRQRNSKRCAQFTSAWAGHGVTIQYQTQHTGLCKPKHARSRAIHIHKPAGMPMTMNMPMAPGQVVGMAPAVGGTVIGMSPPGAARRPMQITLPLDFIPGQPMQVQTPAGTIITVNAPPGAVGGQAIQVRVLSPWTGPGGPRLQSRELPQPPFCGLGVLLFRSCADTGNTRLVRPDIPHLASVRGRAASVNAPSNGLLKSTARL